MSARECIGDEASLSLRLSELEHIMRHDDLARSDQDWLIKQCRLLMSELREYKTAVDGIAQRIGMLEECTHG